MYNEVTRPHLREEFQRKSTMSGDRCKQSKERRSGRVELLPGMNSRTGVVEAIGRGETVEIRPVLSESWSRTENGHGGEGGSPILQCLPLVRRHYQPELAGRTAPSLGALLLRRHRKETSGRLTVHGALSVVAVAYRRRKVAGTLPTLSRIS